MSMSRQKRPGGRSLRVKDAVFAAVRDAGGEVVQEPTTQPWGVRDCAFRDPSGNLVRVNQAS